MVLLLLVIIFGNGISITEDADNNGKTKRNYQCSLCVLKGCGHDCQISER